MSWPPESDECLSCFIHRYVVIPLTFFCDDISSLAPYVHKCFLAGNTNLHLFHAAHVCFACFDFPQFIDYCLCIGGHILSFVSRSLELSLAKSRKGALSVCLHAVKSSYTFGASHVAALLLPCLEDVVHPTAGFRVKGFGHLPHSTITVLASPWRSFECRPSRALL